MRNLIDLVEQLDGSLLYEGEMPATEYGYWITDEGRLIPVPFQSHYAIAKQHHMVNYDVCYNSGWIKVACPRLNNPDDAGSLNVQCAPGEPPLRAILALKKLGSSHPFSRFIVENADDWDFKTFTNFAAFYAYVVTLKKPTDHLAEGIAAPEHYGYWISPEGKVTPVAFEDHLNALYDLIGRKDYGMAFDAGWIRVVTDIDLSIHFGEGKPPMRALIALRDIALEVEFREVFVEVQQTEDQSINDFFDHIGPALQMCFTYRAKRKRNAAE